MALHVFLAWRRRLWNASILGMAVNAIGRLNVIILVGWQPGIMVLCLLSILYAMDFLDLINGCENCLFFRSMGGAQFGRLASVTVSPCGLALRSGVAGAAFAGWPGWALVWIALIEYFGSVVSVVNDVVVVRVLWCLKWGRATGSLLRVGVGLACC